MAVEVDGIIVRQQRTGGPLLTHEVEAFDDFRRGEPGRPGK